MTRISYQTQTGINNTPYIEYWNGTEFTSVPATVKVLDPEKMWNWLEENAPFVADNFSNRVKIETV